MPVNDFEKNVQQKMDELKLRPSENVWEQVEVRIREKKKRRRILLWLIFPALLIGGGISVFVLIKGNDNISLNEKQSLQEEKQTSTENLETLIESNKKTGIKTSETEKDLALKFHEKRQNENNIRPVAIKKDISKKLNKDIFGKDHISEKNDFIKADDKNLQGNEKVAENKFVDVLENKKDTSASLFETDRKNTDTLKADEKLETEKVVVSTDEKPMNDKKIRNTSRITKRTRWGFAIQAGRSYTPHSRDLFNFQPINYSYSSQQSTPGSGFYSISTLRPGLSFGLNLFARQKLSDRLDLNVGLGYSYLSTRVNVGNRIDSSGVLSGNVAFDNYYSATGNSNYTNKYHFADISVLLSWNVLKRNRFQINWENGFYLSRLLSSNALQYSASLRGFYEDFDGFTKNHFSISTGFSIPILNNAKIRMEFNPFASYSLTPVLRHASDSLNTHFTNYGIRLKFLLPAKKQVQR